MDKKVIAIIVILYTCCFGNVNAYNSNKKFGALKFGASSVWIDGTKYDKYNYDINKENSISYSMGLFYNFNISKNFGFRPTLEYNVKGEEYKLALLFYDRNSTIKYTTKLGYIDFSILVVYKKYNINFLFGPYIGYICNGSIKANPRELELEPYSIKLSHDLDFWYSKYDAGLNLGATYLINKYLEVEVKYMTGLKTIDKKPVYIGLNGEKIKHDYDMKNIKNKMIQLSFNYIIRYFN